MKKRVCLSLCLVLVIAGSASAGIIDFRDETIFGGALNQPSFTAGVGGNTVTVTAIPNGARLWWDSADGLGIQYRYGYEGDEIEGIERLRIGFSTPVNIVSVLITDLFNEGGYLERGFYQLNGTGSWIQFTALPGQTPSTSNGELTVLLDPSIAVSSILFRAPGRLPGNQGHEFSVAAIVTDPPNAVPVPGAVWLLGSGLVGLVAIRRRMKK